MNWKFWQKKNKKKNADNKVEEQPIVIPEPIKEVAEFKGNIDNQIHKTINNVKIHIYIITFCYGIC